MRTEAHIEKFERFDRVRARLNPHADFELWYWMALNAGTAIINAALHAAGITRAHDSFATQIPNIYSVAGPDGTRHMEYVFGSTSFTSACRRSNGRCLPPSLMHFPRWKSSRS